MFIFHCLPSVNQGSFHFIGWLVRVTLVEYSFGTDGAALQYGNENALLLWNMNCRKIQKVHWGGDIISSEFHNKGIGTSCRIQSVSVWMLPECTLTNIRSMIFVSSIFSNNFPWASCSIKMYGTWGNFELKTLNASLTAFQS